MAFPKEFEEFAASISLDTPAPTGSFVRTSPSSVLPIRQIGEGKWHMGAAMFRQNTELMELEVASTESGWRYMLFKSEEKDVLIRKVFQGTHLVEESRWNILTEMFPGVLHSQKI